MAQTTETLIIGAGIAGLVAAYELLKSNQRVILVDALPRTKIGGLAKIAFGGMALIATPEQKRLSIPDTPELAYKDWCSFAEFTESDYWPRQWARQYVESARTDIYDYVKALGASFLPAVNWVERGDQVPGNSVPRYHILWGCGARLVEGLLNRILPYEGRLLTIINDSRVTSLVTQNGRITGCLIGTNLGKATELLADNTIIACGGFTGDLQRVRRQWPKDWGKPPTQLLNGSHPVNDGALHDEVSRHGARVTHMDKMWNYAAGLPVSEPEFAHQGISLIPCKSALWLDAQGNRFMPPMVTGFDTTELCRRLSASPFDFSWQIMNRRIALKELAVSGAEYNPTIRDHQLFGLLKDTMLGNKRLVERLIRENSAVVVAQNIDALIDKMNAISEGVNVDKQALITQIQQMDTMILRGEKYWNDAQLRRIIQIRHWPSERLRTCKPEPLLDGSPLIAMKLRLITRKSLGGIQTNLNSQVLGMDGQPIAGLLAIGEAAGFGGGGASGKRSLEGTFLSGCILTARRAVNYLVG